MIRISCISKNNPKQIYLANHLACHLQSLNRTASYNLLLAAFMQPFFSDQTKINTQQIQVALEAQTRQPVLVIFFLTEQNE